MVKAKCEEMIDLVTGVSYAVYLIIANWVGVGPINERSDMCVSKHADTTLGIRTQTI